MVECYIAKKGPLCHYMQLMSVDMMLFKSVELHQCKTTVSKIRIRPTKQQMSARKRQLTFI